MSEPLSEKLTGCYAAGLAFVMIIGPFIFPLWLILAYLIVGVVIFYAMHLVEKWRG